MIAEIGALAGTLIGGAFRLAPEFMKWFERKDERKHELAMFDKQLELDKLRSQAELDQINAQGAINFGIQELEAMTRVGVAQSKKTGNKFVDGLNALVRPVITFWWVIVLYTAALVAEFAYSVQQGESYVTSALSVWGADEKAIVASIISFWFVDRSLRNYGPR